MTRRRTIACDESGASAGLELLALGVVLILFGPFAVAAADIPTGADDVDAAASAAARIAATQRDANEARRVAVNTANDFLRRSRCTSGTVDVEPYVERFEPLRRPGRLPEPGSVTVTVACTIETGRRLRVPWMDQARVRRSAEEDVDPFRSST